MSAASASVAGARFSSFRHRNFRLFFIGQSISNSGNWLTNVALTLLVLKLTAKGVAQQEVSEAPDSAEPGGAKKPS